MVSVGDATASPKGYAVASKEDVMSSITIKVPNWLDKIFAWPVMEYRKHKYGYFFRRIYLGEGEWAILDQEDYYRFGNSKWGIEGKKDKFYAVRNVKNGDKKVRTERLHREIMDAPKGLLVDHRNGNSLDNRRANLRLATHAQNMHNRKKIKTKTSSQYIGASLDKRSGRWASKIRCHGKKVHLGCFGSDIEAAKAYDEAAKKYHGEFARLNFP